MIDTTIYLTSIGILSAIIIAFVIHNLKSNKKDYESKKIITELKKQNDESQKEASEYKAKYNELRKQIIPENKPNTAGTIRVVHFHDPDLFFFG